MSLFLETNENTSLNSISRSHSNHPTPKLKSKGFLSPNHREEGVFFQNVGSPSNRSGKVIIPSNPKEECFMHNHLELQDRLIGNGRRRIYSSTSSVYAEHTISDPNNDQVLYW
jgi:hypothetical protein